MGNAIHSSANKKDDGGEVHIPLIWAKCRKKSNPERPDHFKRIVMKI